MRTSHNITSLSSAKVHPFGSQAVTLLVASKPRHCIQRRVFSSAAYRSDSYRHGFNGKEKETDGTADNYDFGARIYDGRLGRFLGVDKRFRKFASVSSFVYAFNSPVMFYDSDGNEIIIHYLDESGANKYITYVPGVDPQIENDFVKNVHAACTYAMNSPTGKRLWMELSELQKTTSETATNGEIVEKTVNQVVTIKQINIFTPEDAAKSKEGNISEKLMEYQDEFDASIKTSDPTTTIYDGKEQVGTILFDPNVELLCFDESSSFNGYMAASTALVHEASHAVQYAKDPVQTAIDAVPYEKYEGSAWYSPEEERVITNDEHKYVEEINNYEKSNAEKNNLTTYQTQTQRTDSKIEYHDRNGNNGGVNTCSKPKE